jgi:agmatine/peptidylarginine deiminase
VAMWLMEPRSWLAGAQGATVELDLTRLQPQPRYLEGGGLYLEGGGRALTTREMVEEVERARR